MRAVSASRVQGHDISWPYKLVIPSAARNLLFHVVNKFVRETYMLSRYCIHLAELTIAILLALAIYFSWRADRRDRAQLAAEVAATKQLLTVADARQHDRDAQLAQTLAALAAEKRTIVTPAQIVRNLANEIPLPAPITLHADHASSQDTSVTPANAANAQATRIHGASSANSDQAG